MSYMPGEPSAPIGYASRPTRSRRLARRATIWLIPFSVLASSYWWGPVLLHRAELTYRYHDALDYESPNGAIACKIHYADPGGYGMGTEGHIVPEWRRFYDVVSPPGFSSDGTVFVGGLRTPAGRRVLVAVDVQTIRSSPGRADPPLHVRAFTAAGRFEAPQQYLDNQTTVPLQPFFDLRLFAGQRDPVNETHFTIPYESDGRPGTIDGWVKENAVDLELRTSSPTSTSTSSPTTPSPPASAD
jgi:hypothetical protein